MTTCYAVQELGATSEVQTLALIVVDAPVRAMVWLAHEISDKDLSRLAAMAFELAQAVVTYH